ncbi:hypothetical protein [Selenomonas sp. AE3005]|nr:hypothetical protein [Selenomonas sp. AE3005]
MSSEYTGNQGIYHSGEGTGDEWYTNYYIADEIAASWIKKETIEDL